MKKFYYLIIAFFAIANADLNAQTCNTVTSFPFKETFEADSPSRSCWTQQVIGGHYPSYDGWVYKKGSAGVESTEKLYVQCSGMETSSFELT